MLVKLALRYKMKLLSTQDTSYFITFFDYIIDRIILLIHVKVTIEKCK